jgi:hypothetical protein
MKNKDASCLNVKISIPGFPSNLNITQFVGGDQNIGFGCNFFVNDPNVRLVDYWFVCDDLQTATETAIVNRKNVIFLSSEVVYPKGYYDAPHMQKFLDQFHSIFTCHDIYRDNTEFTLPFLGWMINSNHGESIFSKAERDLNWLSLNNDISKTKTISIFCSDQQATADHRLRLKFAKALKTHFGNDLDWYGNGVNPLPEKWDGIAPYKYHIALENQSRNHVITEKLYDSFLGLALPIYYGAPNVGDFFDLQSLEQIDLMDFTGSIKKIEKILETDPWEDKLSSIIDSKSRVLGEYNVFNRIAQIPKKCSRSLFDDSELITLYSSGKFRSYSSLNELSFLLAKVLQKIAIRIIS